MPYQTAAGARKAFFDVLKAVQGLTDIVEDGNEPADFADGVFVTLNEGEDRVLGTLIGGTRPLYEMGSEADISVLTLFKTKAEEAVLRAAISDAIETDPTLGGAVDDVVLSSASNDVDPGEGAERARAVLLRATLFYISTSSVG